MTDSVVSTVKRENHSDASRAIPGSGNGKTGFAKTIFHFRFLFARRLTQLGTLFLFIGAYQWDWKILQGNLSASRLFEWIPLADPFAVLQIFAAGHNLTSDVLIGSGIILLFYSLVGGRVFCSWVCPVNMVTDFAAWSRRKLNISNAYSLSRNLRWVVLGTSLVLSVLTGVAAFEWVSPIGAFHRELIYGLGFGWTAVVGVFLFDLFLVRHGWCGHLCPLGAFYSILGYTRLFRIDFDSDRCTQCGDCHRICPEPHVLKLTDLNKNGLVMSGDCTNCMRCTSVCTQSALDIKMTTPLKSFN